MKRRMISLLVVMALALSMTVPGVTIEAKAATTMPVTVTDADGSPGDTVTVSVSFGVSETHPVKCAQFKLRYDETKLTLVSAVHTSNAPKGLRMFYTSTTGTVNWGWADTKAYTTGGEWAEITFKINEGASGTVPLTFYDTLCAAEADTENYELTITNGTITVLLPEYKSGDVNNDGSITLKDALLALKLSLEADNDFTTQPVLSADIDEDGSIDTKDVLAILQKANGRDIEGLE